MTLDTSFVPLPGGCACGEVRFRLDAAPIITHACHCRTCQKVSGSAFRVNAMIEREHVTLLAGAPELARAPAMHDAMRCPDCLLALWTVHPHLGDGIAFVGVGRLDEGERLAPEAHYFTRSKHPWVELPTGVPAFAERGDPRKPGARERIEAVLAKRARGEAMDAFARG